jgi:hypothetical protein
MIQDNFILGLKQNYNNKTRQIVDSNNLEQITLRNKLFNSLKTLKSEYGLDPNKTYDRLSTFQGLKDYYGDIPNIINIADEYKEKRQQLITNYRNNVNNLKINLDTIAPNLNDETLNKINNYKTEINTKIDNINNTRKSVKGSIQAKQTKFKQAKIAVKDVIDSIKSEYTPIIGGCCCCDICCCVTKSCCGCVCYAKCCDGKGTDLDACCGSNAYDPSAVEACCGSQIYDPETVDCCSGSMASEPKDLTKTYGNEVNVEYVISNLTNVVLSGWSGNSSCGPAYQYSIARQLSYNSNGDYYFSPATSYKNVNIFSTSKVPPIPSYSYYYYNSTLNDYTIKTSTSLPTNYNGLYYVNNSMNINVSNQTFLL